VEVNVGRWPYVHRKLSLDLRQTSNELPMRRQGAICKANTMYFRLYKDAAGYWRWTLYASNGRKIADSGEGYVNKSDCQAGIDLVKSTSAFTPVRE
jgi:uncharacterized protein YegP (UPF0339 family)